MTTAAQALEALDKLRIAVTWAPDAGQERYREQLDAIRQHIESTAAELEALRKDAERWRLFRDGDCYVPASERVPEHSLVMARLGFHDTGYLLCGSGVADYDAAIDEAAALTQGGK